YMNSLKRLQGLEVRRIYPAHGPVIEDGPARIQEYIDHRLMRERQILQALGDGLATIPAMVEKIYAEVPKTLHPMAAQSVGSHPEPTPRPSARGRDGGSPGGGSCSPRPPASRECRRAASRPAPSPDAPPCCGTGPGAPPGCDRAASPARSECPDGGCRRGRR